MPKILIDLNPKFIEYRNWIFKGGVSILDQGIYSGTNFLVSLLLARWLNVHDFGIYSIAIAFFSLFYQLQNALIIEPMSVNGPAFHANSIDYYLVQQKKLHFILLIPLGLLILVFTLIFGLFNGYSDLSQVLIVLGLLTSLLQLPWLIRLTYYVKNQPIMSVLYSTIYGILFLGSLFLLKIGNRLTPSITLVAMSVAGLIAAMCIMRKKNSLKQSDETTKLKKILFQNWSYGRWILLSGLLTFMAGQAPLYLSGLMIGTDAAGVIKALQNFMLPLAISFSSINSLFIPILSKEYAHGKRENVKSKKKLITLGTVILALLYEICLIFFSGPLETFLYNGKYHEYISLIPLWGGIPILMALNSGASAEIRASQKPQGIFIIVAIWTLVTLVSIFFFIPWKGILGATLGTILGYAISIIAYFFVARKIEKS